MALSLIKRDIRELHAQVITFRPASREFTDLERASRVAFFLRHGEPCERLTRFLDDHDLPTDPY